MTFKEIWDQAWKNFRDNMESLRKMFSEDMEGGKEEQDKKKNNQ